MISQRRMANSAGTLPRTSNSNQGPQIRKRVRFLDRAFAQELIHREKVRLEEKMQALRQAYDFRQAVSGSSEASKAPDGEEQRRNSLKLQAATRSDEEEEQTSESSKRQLRPRKTKVRQGSFSAERLSELAKPRSKNGMLPSNSSRRNAIVAASPEHLKLSVPERSPRTIPQLKHLSEDEVDYLVQPKTVHEFQQLAEINLRVPHGIVKRSGRESRVANGGGSAPSHQESTGPGAKEIKHRDTSNQTDDSRNIVDSRIKPTSSPAKPSFKMAARGVLSMKTQERNELAPKTFPLSISDLFSKSLPPKLALKHRAKPNMTGFDMQPGVPGSRVLRLRPRKSAWLESRMKKRPSKASELPQDESSKTGDAAGSSPDSESPRSRSSSLGYAFASPVKYHKWRDKPTIDVEQLTKNLSKCSYLRGAKEDIDVTEVFVR